MPDLRVLTWNSGGEADGRGAFLVFAVNFTNAAFPGAVPVQVVVTQEANVGGGSIAGALANGPPFNTFVAPQGFSREHLMPPAQPFRVMPSRAYRMSWLVGDPVPGNNLATPAGNPALVPLDPMVDPGVNAFIAGLGLAPLAHAQVAQAAANCRWPIYRHLTFAGPPVQNIHFFSWHAPLRANWLGAAVLGLGLAGPGLGEALFFLQNSAMFTGILAGLGANDVVIIAGDLNLTAVDIGAPWFFPGFVGATSNLSHILAFSPGFVGVNQNVAYATPFPPHDVLSARVQW